jgi:hypothetical protein
MEQTAVEWLYDNLKSHFEHDGDLLEVVQFSFEQAIEMEEKQIGYSEEEVKRLAFKFYLDMSNKMKVPDNLITENYTNVDEWFEQINPIKAYYNQMDKEVHFNRGNLNK